MDKVYRTGAVGALMDEYERAAAELKVILINIPQDHFVQIVDPHTADPSCRSIQTIMNHVVRAGYGYANYMRQLFGADWIERKEDYGLTTPAVACSAMDQMLTYQVDTLANKWDINPDNLTDQPMKTTWGQSYDFEQLFEHAIVHILRHRRQIERFLIKVLL